MKAREVNRRIEQLGGKQVRQCGSHRTYEAPYDGGVARTTVPQHHRIDLTFGTLRSIERNLEPAFGKGWLRRK